MAGRKGTPSDDPSLRLWGGLGTLFLLVVWAVAAVATGSDLVLPGPLGAAAKLAALATEARFWTAVGRSALRVAAALLLAFPLSLTVGIAAGLSAPFRAFIRPWLTTISATPVLAIILVVLLWAGPERVPVLVSLLVLLPVMTGNVIEGVLATDRKLLEAARSFRFSRFSLLRHVYVPSMRPFLLAGTRTSVSLAWKAVVAAEVIAQPRFALGSGMQRAKAQLETPELFAWTAATVLLAWSSDAILARLASRRAPGA